MGLEDILGGIFEAIEQQQQQQQEQQRQVPLEPETDPLPRHGSRPETAIGRVMHAVVQIVALRQSFLGGLTSAWTGSGTIVHPSGIILTNCHVADPRAMGMSAPPADRLGIAITERSDRPPAMSYFAEVVASSPTLDLAVLRIVADVKGQPLSDLDLTSVELGDSDQLTLGDRLAIFGYPGIGGETVTFTAGNVAGFTSQRGVREPRAWIKTDATIAGGNSGGTAVNQSGQLVGVPTQAAAGAGVTPVDARPVLDTNRDGRVDQRDTPMAVGGFINGLRPVNLAIPLLEKAGIRIQPDRSETPHRSPTILPSDEPLREEHPMFRELLFSTQVSEDGRPIHPTTNIPPGVSTIYATFEHVALERGTPWSVVWLSDGNVIIDQRDRWDDESHGRKVVKISNRKGLPVGEYHLVLGIGAGVALEGKVVVGTPTDESDAEISGRLVDESTGAGIRGGLVVILTPGTPMQDFLRQRRESQVLTSTETKSDGSFTLPDQLPKGNAYSLIAAANGFRPVTVEGALRVGSGAPERADIGSIELTRA